jgi:hypothetical protein
LPLETNQSKHTQLHLPSLIQFICSILATLTLIGIAITIGMIAISQAFLPTNQPEDPLPSLLIAAGLFLIGCLSIPSAVYALARLIGWHLPSWKIFPKLLSPIFWILAFPLVLEAGNLLSKQKTLSWLFLPVLHILAIGIPVAWLISIGCRRLKTGSDQRTWGSFGSGLVLAPMLIIIAEITALVIFILFSVMVIASSPGLTSQLLQITKQIPNLSQDPDAMVQALSPILARPWFLIFVLAFGSVMVPLIEELLKPMGVWLLAGRSLTPAEGFIAGVLSGAGYSLFESLALSSNAGDWSTIVIARISTGIIHITTTALSGWAIASAWRFKRYIQLGIMYMLVVVIHGLWNALAITAAFISFPFINISAPTFNLALSVGEAAPLALVVLMAGTFLMLILSNRAVQRSQ